MSRIQIKADATFDGEYDLDFEGRTPTGTELHLFKEIGGVLPATLEAALAGGDYDVVITMAVIALRRAEKITKAQVKDAVEVLLEAPVGCITVMEEEAGALPPALSENGSGSPGTSGSPSRTPSGNQDSILPLTGSRG